MADDTAADSTQGPQTKEAKQTLQPAEASSREQAESSSSLAEKDTDQVGSTDNGISSVPQRPAEDVDMLPESSSSEAQGKVVSSMEAEPSSASSLQSKQNPPVEQVKVVSIISSITMQLLMFLSVAFIFTRTSIYLFIYSYIYLLNGVLVRVSFVQLVICKTCTNIVIIIIFS